MSNYATLFSMPMDDGDEDALWGPENVGAPYRYQGSHVLPSEDDPRDGSLEIAGIPAFCGADGGLVDFLRLSVSPNDDGDPLVDLVLDRDQVKALRECLTEWLTREVEEG